MLTTRFSGGLRARPLEARPERDAGLIWLVTDVRSGKEPRPRQPDGTNRKSRGLPDAIKKQIETIETTVAESADNPEITLQKKNRGELIRAALMKLSADDRDILDLVYFHENSVEDCALILNLPVATVKTRMLSARKKLAELVQEA
jgi:RNA polymerase sigma factor (sigma-70 family)